MTALLREELIVKLLSLLELSIKMFCFFCFPEILFNGNKYIGSFVPSLQSQNK